MATAPPPPPPPGGARRASFDAHPDPRTPTATGPAASLGGAAPASGLLTVPTMRRAGSLLARPGQGMGGSPDPTRSPSASQLQPAQSHSALSLSAGLSAFDGRAPPERGPGGGAPEIRITTGATQPQDGLDLQGALAGIPPRQPRSLAGSQAGDVPQAILAVEGRLEAAATGPPPEHRAVTKAELSSARCITGEALQAHLDGKEYEAATRQLDKEFAAAAALREDVEKQRQVLEEANQKLKADILQKDKDMQKRNEEQVKFVKTIHRYQRTEKNLQEEKQTLDTVIERLVEEIDVLKDNLAIQETNVDRLKELAERLQEDIARAQKRQEETQEKHRLAILRMETEIAKDVDELNAEYSAKEAELRRMLDKSQDLRQKAEQEWAERESRMAKIAKEEVRAKNEELQKLRAKIEVLLREQIDAMRDRVRHQPHGDSAAAKVTAGGAQGRPARRAGRAPRDLAVHTHEVLSEVAAGRRILSVSLSCRAGDFRQPVSWQGKGPRHHCDVMAEDIAVQLAVDKRVLHPVPDAARRGTSSGLSALLRDVGGQGEEWRFATPHGTELVVAVRLLPPGAP